jgi:hypothetical protein
MSASIISLAPTMTRRLNFKHPLFDDVDDYKIPEEEVMSFIKGAIRGNQIARDGLILGYMWLAKDVVMRYRAHFPETRRFTEDMVSVSLEALTEVVNSLDQPANLHNKIQAFVQSRIRDFINDNRSISSSSIRTNFRRQSDDKPLEYNFSQQLTEDIGEEDYHPDFVDILDSVEQLQQVDKEQMFNLIHMFLRQNHNIDEASLSEDEQNAIERLSEIASML